MKKFFMAMALGLMCAMFTACVIDPEVDGPVANQCKEELHSYHVEIYGYVSEGAKGQNDLNNLGRKLQEYAEADKHILNAGTLPSAWPSFHITINYDSIQISSKNLEKKLRTDIKAMGTEITVDEVNIEDLCDVTSHVRISIGFSVYKTGVDDFLAYLSNFDMVPFYEWLNAYEGFEWKEEEYEILMSEWNNWLADGFDVDDYWFHHDYAYRQEISVTIHHNGFHRYETERQIEKDIKEYLSEMGALKIQIGFGDLDKVW